MGIHDGLTHEIIRRVLTAANPDRIILFGSAATGQMNRDSDIDLLIVEPAPAKQARGERQDSKVPSAILGSLWMCL